jgi:hypothetical protein
VEAKVSFPGFPVSVFSVVHVKLKTLVKTLQLVLLQVKSVPGISLDFPNGNMSVTQVARVQFPVPARPTFRVEKVALFCNCNPASGGTFSSTAIEIIKWVKKIAVAQAKVSHILRPGNTAFK